MKKAMMYGAGNIGRGFIGQLFSQSGYEVVFLDINSAVIDRLNRDGSYPLRFVTADTQYEELITNVRGVNACITETAAAEIAGADLMATAVGAKVLPHIVPVIAMGLTQRWQLGDFRPLNILICENLKDAKAVLRKLLLENLDAVYHTGFDQLVGLVETSVGRMVPVPTAAMQEGNSTRIWAEPYHELPADQDGFRGGIPDMMGLLPRTPFAVYVERKLYMHNMSHAMLAYLGAAAGHTYIWQAVQDREIRKATLAALEEAAHALHLKHGLEQEELSSFGFNLMSRFDNRMLGDTVARVGRDPIRKLAENDRLTGAARLCVAQGIQADNICRGIAAALRYSSADDPAAREMQALIADAGPAAVLERYAGIGSHDPLLARILSFWDTVDSIR